MTTQKQKPRRMAGVIQDRIEELALTKRNWSATQIYEDILNDSQFNGLTRPDKRTVQRMVKDTIPRDNSSPWRLGETDPAEASSADVRFILRTLAVVIEQTEGSVNYITCNQAEWIQRIMRAADDLHPWAVYCMALAYQKRGETDSDTRDLDSFLAYAPWRNVESERSYHNAILAGYIPRLPGRAGLIPPFGLPREEDIATVKRIQEQASRLKGPRPKAIIIEEKEGETNG